MAIKSYIITRDLRTPYVVGTGLPHKPTEIKTKVFKKGEIIKGELKHANNQPAFVLVGGALMVPLDFAKEVVTKEIVANADGETKKITTDGKKIALVQNPKVKYLDGVVIGALAGVGIVYLMQKKGFIKVPDNKNYLYGAAVVGALGLYITYRLKNKIVAKNPE